MRIKEKKIKTIIEWLKYGGKDHFHHRLIDLGLRPFDAVLFIYFVTFALGLAAIIISTTVETMVGLFAVLQGSIIFCLIAVLMLAGRKHRRKMESTEGKEDIIT